MLIEEFCVVRRSPTCETRRLDVVIVKNEPSRIVHQSEISIEGKDLIVVQAKIGRLGMNVTGQTLFSRVLLLQRSKPRSVEAVALVMNDDDVPRPLLEQYAGRVVVLSRVGWERDTRGTTGRASTAVERVARDLPCRPRTSSLRGCSVRYVTQVVRRGCL